MDLTKPQIISLPKVCDPRGNLSFIQNGQALPFEIKRAFWIYDVPGGKRRYGHAYRSQQELIVALSGSFDVTCDDGRGNVLKFSLNRSYYGLYLPPLTWREIDNFSTNSVALVVSSQTYDEADYLRDYHQFKSIADNFDK